MKNIKKLKKGWVALVTILIICIGLLSFGTFSKYIDGNIIEKKIEVLNNGNVNEDDSNNENVSDETKEEQSIIMLNSESKEAVEVSDEASLREAVKEDRNIKLASDIKMSGGTLVIDGVNITLDLNGHTLSGNGESTVIKITEGELTLNDSDGNGKITGGKGNNYIETGNYKGNSGGGVYIGGNGIFTMNGGTITKNTAEHGGGVSVGYTSDDTGWNYTYGSFIMNGGTITGNTANGNGAGVNIIVYANLTMNGGTISENIANENGGGVFIHGGLDAKTKFDMNNGKIINNEAKKEGGGVFVVDADFTMADGTLISGNKAEQGGGVSIGSAIYYNYDTGILKMDGGEIRENTAEKDGGGVYVYRSGLTINKGTIENNDAENGGGVYYYGDSEFLKMKKDGGEITKNTAINGGGLYYIINSDHGVPYDAYYAITNNSAVNGGGVYVELGEYGYGYFYIDYSKIKGNTASKNGGGVYIDKEATVSISCTEYAEIETNTAGENGGGVYVAGKFIFDGKIGINKNNAKNGGGVYIDKGGILEFGNHGFSPIINENTATDVGGGLYVAEQAIVTIEDIYLNVSNNTSGGNGGGIYFAGDNFMSSGYYPHYSLTINKNTSGGNGGGIYFAGKKFSFDQQSSEFNITNNTAEGSGGGMYAESGEIVIGGRRDISSNTAGGSGGALYIAKNADSLNITGGDWIDVSYNKAEKDGGGMYVGSKTFTIGGEEYSPNIQYNTAGGDGGGLYVTSDEFSILSTAYEEDRTSTSISYNVAENNGGGVYFDGGVFTFGERNAIAYNTAKGLGNEKKGGGGGAYIAGGTFYVQDNVKIINNRAGSDNSQYIANGGGVYVAKDGTFVMRSNVPGVFYGKLYNNIADNETKISKGGHQYSNCSGDDIYGEKDSTVTLMNVNKDDWYIDNSCGHKAKYWHEDYSSNRWICGKVTNYIEDSVFIKFGGEFTPDGEIALKAAHPPFAYKVRYWANKDDDGDGEYDFLEEYLDIPLGEPHIVESAKHFLNNQSTKDTITREGYVMVRWTENPKGTGKEYTIGESITSNIDGDVIDLYAQWEPGEYDEEQDTSDINPNNPSIDNPNQDNPNTGDSNTEQSKDVQSSNSENPKTLDNIIKYVVMCIISGITIIGIILFARKRKKRLS